MNFVAFQQFRPLERPAPEGCIWCDQKKRTNRAHIISRKLAPGARNTPVLRFSVCKPCNTECSKLEEWILRRTPLSWLRLMLYVTTHGDGTSRHIPSCFFSDLLQEWVAFHLDAKTHSYAVATQLIHPPDRPSTLLTETPQDQHKAIVDTITAAVSNRTYSTDIRSSLPEAFAPRLLLDEDRVILIARTESEAARASDTSLAIDFSTAEAQYTQLDNTGREQHHFRWSSANWTRFCAKTALEALCLFEGGEKCLAPAFRTAREFVIRGKTQDGREILFGKHGPMGDGDAPTIPMVDLTNGQSAPKSIAAVIPRCEVGMHVVAVYEIHGWVLASVSFAGIPPSIMVLGGPDEHLADFYQLIYDEQEANYVFSRLAYDQASPIIPLPMPGDHFRDLAETYGLSPTDADG